MSSTQSSGEDRAKGCFWGQLIGDALGSTYEFQESKHVKARIEKALDNNGHLRMLGGGPFGLAVGQVTDDSEMALSLAGTLIRDGTYKQESVACAYSRWMLTAPPDIGTTTSAALADDRRLKKTWWTTMSEQEINEVLHKVLGNVAVNNKKSQSNGCLMRISPLAVAYWHEPEKLLEYGELDVALTHIQENCFDAIRVYLTAASALILGETPEEALADALKVARTEMIKVHLEDSKKFAVPVRLSSGYTTNGDDTAIGYVGVALQVAFHEMLTCSSFSEGLINSIKIGGDTDTNAAITGALLGARFGEAAIPEDWIRDVRNAPLRLQGENSIDTVESILHELLHFNKT